MINISIWNNDTGNKKILSLCKSLLDGTFDEDLNLIYNKTFVVSIIENNNILGTISIISNNDLIEYFRKKKIDIESLQNIYCFRGSSGVYIYNLAVNKKYRNKGVAKKLISIALHIASIKSFKYCYVHCDNDISSYIFKKIGFIQENTFTNKKGKLIRMCSYWL